jgi:hypothetical protein
MPRATQRNIPEDSILHVNILFNFFFDGSNLGKLELGKWYLSSELGLRMS